MKIHLKKIIKQIFKQNCFICDTYQATQHLLCDCCFEELPWITNEQQNGYFSAFHYQPPISDFITQLKFQRQLFYARILGGLLSHLVSSLAKPDLIIPVPLHHSRLRKRGFNQALEIAKIISKNLNIPIDHKSCTRRKATLPQTSLTQAQRKLNVRGAFVNKLESLDRHIVIIDDVITTGSTIKSFIKTFPKDCRVSVWSCAQR